MNAQFAVTLLLTLVCVACAALSFFNSRAARKARLTISMRAELDEMQDAIGKHSALLKRINSRTVMQERRAAAKDASLDESDAAQMPGESAAAWKARMRAKLIVPGRPTKHG